MSNDYLKRVKLISVAANFVGSNAETSVKFMGLKSNMDSFVKNIANNILVSLNEKGNLSPNQAISVEISIVLVNGLKYGPKYVKTNVLNLKMGEFVIDGRMIEDLFPYSSDELKSSMKKEVNKDLKDLMNKYSNEENGEMKARFLSGLIKISSLEFKEDEAA